MKWPAALVLIFLCGCSTRPLVDCLDFFFPAKIRIDPKVQPYGGVCGTEGGGLTVPSLPPIAVPMPPASGQVVPPPPPPVPPAFPR